MANLASQFVLHIGLNIAFLYNFLAVRVSNSSNNFVLTNSHFSNHPYLTGNNGENAFILWRDLEIVAEEMFKFQNNLQPQQGQTTQDRLVLVLCERATEQEASKFVSNISKMHDNVQFLYFQIRDPDVFVDNEIEQIVTILVNNRNTITNVIMFLENTTTIFEIINYISIKVELKFTAVIHVTEWIIVFKHLPSLIPRIQESAFQIDFISVICKEDDDIISIAQKPRGSNFSVRARMLIHHVQNVTSVQESHKTVARYFHSLAARKSIRKSGDIYLKSKKSVLAGLHIPVAMISLDLQDRNLRINSKKLSNHENYGLKLLDYLATHLDFTYEIVVAKDNGFFGMVSNGAADGVTGQLARREAALTTLPMSPTYNRLGVMDFVPVHLSSEFVYIVYRLPQPTDSVDMTYIKIFRPEFIYVHIGPVVFILLFRAAVHVCIQFWPRGHAPVIVCSWRNLLSFFGDVCYKRTEIASWQFERVLVASWHVFFFIMWSSYSAYLVTSFVAKPQELTIRSFKELDDNRNLKIGTLSSLSATMFTLQTSENAQIKSLWERLVRLNQSDSLTLSPNVSVHMHRIVAGGYVYIGGIHVLPDDGNILVNYTDVRYYISPDFYFRYTSFLGIANGVFYKDTLWRFLQSLEENGMLGRLKYLHLSTNFVTLSEKVKISEENTPVTLTRIALILFLILGGIFFGFLILMCEYIIRRLYY